MDNLHTKQWQPTTKVRKSLLQLSLDQTHTHTCLQKNLKGNQTIASHESRTWLLNKGNNVSFIKRNWHLHNAKSKVLLLFVEGFLPCFDCSRSIIKRNWQPWNYKVKSSWLKWTGRIQSSGKWSRVCGLSSSRSVEVKIIHTLFFLLYQHLSFQVKYAQDNNDSSLQSTNSGLRCCLRFYLILQVESETSESEHNHGWQWQQQLQQRAQQADVDRCPSFL